MRSKMCILDNRNDLNWQTFILIGGERDKGHSKPFLLEEGVKNNRSEAKKNFSDVYKRT